ncbi:OmpH family outer membrane protein [Yoonia sp. 208BN28-4]|uniref:OmpH family outer membrane protein n=1 Tax=Yoonia sp. 208BN28-4 TaxID=3126505 RepID=UPI0030AF36F3
MRRPLGYLAGCIMAMLLAGQAVAQDTAPTPAPSSVLIIDNDVLFLNTAYGQRILSELDAAAQLVQAENDRIVAELVAEESSLTDRRPTMAPDVFRAEAAAFDAKAQELRRERDAARDDLVARRSAERAAFFDRVHPIIGRLMLERNASVVLDRRSVFLAVGSADITQDAIALVNETLGDGTRPEPVTPPDDPIITPAPSPDTPAVIDPIETPATDD